MNALAPISFGRGTGLATRDDVARSLNNMSMVAPRVGGEYQFLKMDKGNGDWLYGQEETVVEEGSLWAVNPTSLEYGYIAWPPESSANREPEGEVMVPISRPLPDKNSLRTNTADGGTTGAGWQYQQSVVVVCVSGDDVGVQALYKQSSVGSQKLFKSLVDAISAQVAKGEDAIVPLIEMKSDSYKHSKWGRIYNPIFEIKEWRTLDDGTPPEDDSGEPTKTPEQAPTRTRTRAAAAPVTPPPADEPDEEAELAREYEAEQAKAAAAPAAETPRRRLRRP